MSQSNADSAINKILWQMNLLKTVPNVPATIKTIFEQPSKLPPYTVVSSLVKSDVERMNEQQKIYTFLKSVSTVRSHEASSETFSKEFNFHDSNIRNIDKRLVDIKKKLAISEATITNASQAAAKYKESSLVSARLIVPLQIEYTNLSNALVQNNLKSTDINNELTSLKYKIAEYESNYIRDNPGYVYSTIVLSNLQKEYLENANAILSVKNKLIFLGNETIRTGAAYTTAIRGRGTAESTLSTIDGNILRFSIISTNSYINGIEQRTVSTIAELDYKEDEFYYILSQFYASSNDLKNQLIALGQAQQGGGGLIGEAENAVKQGGGSVAAAAYDMAKYSYYHIGGQTKTVKELYESTVTGIAVFEQDSFSKISRFHDNKISVAKDTADTFTTMKQDAQRDIETCTRRVTDLTTKKEKYNESSLEIEGLIRKNNIDYKAAIDAMAPLISARNFAATALEQYEINFKRCSTQYDTIALDIAKNIELSTIKGREVESIDMELPNKRAEYEMLLESYTNTDSELTDIRLEIQHNSKIHTINTRYQQVATYKALLADRILNYYNILNLIASERIKETDARAERVRVGDELKERLKQLHIIAGSEPPDLTEKTYVELSNNMSKLNTFIDNNYTEFYKVGDEFADTLPAYEEIINLINMTGASYIDLENQKDQALGDTATITALQVTEKQLIDLKRDEANRKMNLDKLRDTILKYASILKSNRDALVPANVQEATQRLIDSTQSSIPETLPEPGPPS